MVLAWSHARSIYRIPHRYAEQLITGVARDLQQTRYQTFDDLAEYCYGVASTVGLMSMHIVGFSGPEAIPYAVKLGVALQITNILRDVGEDYRAGRVYLPQEDLAAFGLHDSILLNIMTHHPDELKPIFTLMFRHNPIQRIFRFLDETATLGEEARFLASLPPWRFLQALFRLKVLRRV